MKTLITVLLCSLGFFLFLQSIPGIPGGDDGYRHVAFAHNIITDWQTVKDSGWHILYLWRTPVDIWFLFHLLLSPFTLILPPIMAVKVFSTVIFGLLILLFLKLADELQIKYKPFWLLILLAGSHGLLFRLALSRPFSLSLLIILWGALEIIRNKKIWFFLISVFHAFSYSVFFLILVLPVAKFLVQRTKASLALLGLGIIGILAGLALNPFFPENVYFGIIQSFAPLWIGLTHGLLIGMELHPLGPSGLWGLNSILIFWLIGISLFLYPQKREINQNQWYIFTISILFFVASLQTQRTIDYFIFFAVLFAGSVLTPYLDKIPWKSIGKSFDDYMILFPTLCAAIGIACIVVYNLTYAVRGMQNSPSPYLYYGASSYLLGHSQPGDVVFNTQWDQFPQLFFWNSKNYYILGMDPTFMYLYDRNKYWLWHHISSDAIKTCQEQNCEGKPQADVGEVIKKEFNSSYVIIENYRNPKLKRYLESRKDTKRVYTDDRTTVFQIL